MEWYGEDEGESIRALARAWHDQCKGDCDCEVRHRERTLLSRLRAFLPHKYRALHVREVH